MQHKLHLGKYSKFIEDMRGKTDGSGLGFASFFQFGIPPAQAWSNETTN